MGVMEGGNLPVPGKGPSGYPSYQAPNLGPSSSLTPTSTILGSPGVFLQHVLKSIQLLSDSALVQACFSTHLEP